MKKKFLPIFLALIIFLGSGILQANSVNAAGLSTVGSSALKLFGSIGVKGGVKATSKGALEKGTKHNVKKLTKDGKVVSPEQWVKDNKTKPTQTAYGGKFLKYTLATAGVIGLASLSSDNIQNMPVQNGSVTLDYNQVFNNSEGTVDTISFATTEWTQNNNMSTGTTSKYLGVDFTNLTTGLTQSAFIGYVDQASAYYRTDRGTVYGISKLVADPTMNRILVTFYSIVNGTIASVFTGALWLNNPVSYVPTQDFFPSIQSLVPGQPYSYFEDIARTDLDATKKIDTEIVKDPAAPETEIFVPNNPDGLEQVRKNPDILTNPAPYVDSVPDGAPETNKDIDGDPILDENGNPLPEPSPDPGGGVTPPPAGGDVPPKLDLTPLQVALGTLTTVFPFSIPWDVYKLFSYFNIVPVTPVFDFNINESITLGGKSIAIKYDFDVDFGVFDPIAKIFRWGLILVFDISIILSLRRLTPD